MPETPDALTPRRRADDILSSLAPRGIRPGVAFARRLLAALDHPCRDRPCVLVAGTNGKGSTAALLAAMAQAAGYRTGRFTSPARSAASEQVEIDGTPVPDQRLASRLTEVIATGERLRSGRLTAFEALTAAALVLFEEAGVELAILEAGMGGRDDATNAIDATVCVLTTVGLDHQRWLGDGIAEIARAKAGIFRPNRPAVIGWLEPAAAAAAGEVAQAIGALPCFAAEAVIGLRSSGRGLEPQRVRFDTARGDYDLILPLLGAHQAHNLALAVLAAEHLAAAGFQRFDARAVRAGAAGCRWPCRLEPLTLPEGACALVDGAHNPSGALALHRFLDHLGSRPATLVFAAYADKDADAMLDTLAPAIDRAELAPLDDPRTWRPDRRRADRLAVPATVHADLASALGAALADAGGDAAPLVVVCGSLRTAAVARAWLCQRGGRGRA